MAKSRFEYVRQFEAPDSLLPHCWIVVRLDGKGFTRFADAHGFAKPNDARALALMDASAEAVMREFGAADLRLAFGESDEYSFVFHKHCAVFKRRASKLVSLVVSLFSATYVRLWPAHLPGVDLRATPFFDARAVCYPSDDVLRDYLSWRQADTHINNQYNTCFWALRQQGGMTAREAQAALQGTQTAFKNELLFSRFGINYNDLPARFRKGSIIVWLAQADEAADGGAAREPGYQSAAPRAKRAPAVLHTDIIGRAFWEAHPDVLAG